MPRLRLHLSETPLRGEWEHLRGALRRGAKAPGEGAARIDLSTYRSSSVIAARRAWLRRVGEEHRSATVFVGLLPQLIEAEAPLDFQGILLRMAIEELRHAELCAELVRALGGQRELEAFEPALLTEKVAEHPRSSPRVRALRNVIYACCVSETVSVSLTTAEREHSEEPYAVAILDQLLGDEILHARFGWLYLTSTLPELSAEEREAVESYLPFALAHYRREVTPRGHSDPQIEEEEEAERMRLGLGPVELYREILEETLARVVLPQLRAQGLRIPALRARKRVVRSG